MRPIGLIHFGHCAAEIGMILVRKKSEEFCMQERRQSQRHGVSAEFLGRELSLAGSPRPSAPVIRGNIKDISKGGLCLLTKRRIREACLIRGETILPNTTVGLPSILRVCWVQQVAKGTQYRTGLQFLF